MIYIWECDGCHRRTEVERKVEDYEVPPDKCPKCPCKNLTRKISMTPVMWEQAYDTGVLERDPHKWTTDKM